MIKLTNYLSHSYGKPDGHKLGAYQLAGGYRSARKALGMPRRTFYNRLRKYGIL